MGAASPDRSGLWWALVKGGDKRRKNVSSEKEAWEKKNGKFVMERIWGRGTF